METQPEARGCVLGVLNHVLHRPVDLISSLPLLRLQTWDLITVSQIVRMAAL